MTSQESFTSILDNLPVLENKMAPNLLEWTLGKPHSA